MSIEGGFNPNTHRATYEEIQKKMQDVREKITGNESIEELESLVVELKNLQGELTGEHDAAHEYATQENAKLDEIDATITELEATLEARRAERLEITGTDSAESNTEAQELADEIDRALEARGSQARVDRRIEGGIVSIDLTPELREKLKDWPSARAAFEAADGGSRSWYNIDLRDYPYFPITNAVFEIVITSIKQKTTPADRDTIVRDMETLGYRPLTLAELIALGIEKLEFTKREESFYTYRPEHMDNGGAPDYERYLTYPPFTKVNPLQVPFLGNNGNVERKISSMFSLTNWDMDNPTRLLFTRK